MTYRAVWRSAHQLVLEYCDGAGLQAAMNADRALEEGRLDVYRFWKKVIDALQEMGRRTPINGERLN